MNEDLQLALDYLDNGLSQEERLAFENRLNTDPELRLLLEDIEKSKELSGHLIELETRNVLNAIQKPNSTRKWMYWLAAASIILLMYVPFYFKDNNRMAPSKEELFALMVDPAPLQLRSDSLMNDALSEATQYYQNKQYTIAISKLENLIVDSSHKVQYQRYLGHSYLRIENWQKGDSLFRILSGNSVQEISIEANYHRCIIAIALKNKALAKELYQIIQTSSQISETKKKTLDSLINKM